MNWFKKLWKKNTTTTTIGTTKFLKKNQELWKKILQPANRNTCTDRPKGKQGVLVEYRTHERSFPNLKFKFHPFGYKPSPFKNARTFGQALERRGFKRLGSGAFSTVYGKDGQDRVLKVTHRPDNWIDYAHWGAQQGFAGGLVPKVYSYKVVMNKFQVAVVERMEHDFEPWSDDEEVNKSDFSLVPLLIGRAKDGNIKAGKILDDIVPGFSDFLSSLKVRFDGQRLDLHGGNMMVRKDGSFCVTDPVCSMDGSTFKRLKAGDFTPAQALKGFL